MQRKEGFGDFLCYGMGVFVSMIFDEKEGKIMNLCSFVENNEKWAGRVVYLGRIYHNKSIIVNIISGICVF